MKSKIAALAIAASTFAPAVPLNAGTQPTLNPAPMKTGAERTKLRTAEKRSPEDAAMIANLLGAISRSVKPHWQPPEGSAGMSSTVRFELNRDGSLAGEPTVIHQRAWKDSPSWVGSTGGEPNRQS